MGNIDARLSRIEKQLSPVTSREESAIEADIARELLKLLPDWPRDMTATFEADAEHPDVPPQIVPVSDERYAEIVAKCQAIKEQIDAGTMPLTFDSIMSAMPSECVNNLAHHGGR